MTTKTKPKKTTINPKAKPKTQRKVPIGKRKPKGKHKKWKANIKKIKEILGI